MIYQDLVNRVVTAHEKTVKAALRWSEAAAKGHSVNALYNRYEQAETRFDAAMVALVQNK